MTEKHKMLAGMVYDSRDPELLSMYHKCKSLLSTFNNLDSRLTIQKNEVLSSLFEYIGKNVWIEAPFYCDYGENISIDEGTFINVNCVFIDNNKIKIGKNCLLAPYVQIYTASHPIHSDQRIVDGSYITSTMPVAVGDHVWIGGNTVIFPGVSIGSHSTIGAGSVVTKDIPDHTLAYGNPCKIIKSI